MNSNRNLRTVIFAVLALLLVALVPQALRAQDEGCSDSTLSGTYRATASGTVLGVGPFAGINGVVLDGAGNGQSFGRTQSVNGVIITVGTQTVTYTVNADCTGTATFANGTAHFNIVVDRHGAGWFFVRTDPGTQASGYTIRLDESDSDQGCSVSTLKGSYRAIGGGTVGITGPNTGVPIAVVNNLDLDGSGNGQVTEGTFAVNGSISSGVTFTVAYTVNADCTGTATFTPSSGPAANFHIVVDSKGAGFFFIQTDPGNVVSGRVVRLDKDHDGEDHEGEEK